MSYYSNEESRGSISEEMSIGSMDDTGCYSVPYRHCNIRGTNLCRRLEETTDSIDTDESRHLKVYLRIKPGQAKQNISGLYEINTNNTLTTVETKNDCKYRKTYKFTKVFSPQTEQVQVFDSVVKDNIVQFIDHDKDFSLLTYGTSGSGKTYSLMGTDSQPGVIPRCLETLFSKIKVSKHPCRRPGNAGLSKLTPGEVTSEINVRFYYFYNFVAITDKSYKFIDFTEFKYFVFLRLTTFYF